MKVNYNILYVAIRCASDDGHEFVDVNTFSYDKDECMDKTSYRNELLGIHYNNKNPVVRYSKVKLEDVE